MTKEIKEIVKMEDLLSIKSLPSSQGGWIVELFILSHRNTTSLSSFSKINVGMRGKSQRKLWLYWVQYATDTQMSIVHDFIDKMKITKACLNEVDVHVQHGCLQKYWDAIPVIVSKALLGDAGKENKFYSFSCKRCSKQWILRRFRVDSGTRRPFSHLGKHQAGLLKSAGCHKTMKPSWNHYLCDFGNDF